jgi:cation:H+ antiporter
MTFDILLLAAGGFGVWLGAEGMVKGAVALAKYLGVSALVIGSTIVAFGTSAPELVVSAAAAYQGHAQLAFGNVLGSNIFNIAVVLGLSAVIAPVTVASDVLKRDMPIMIGATLLLPALAFFGNEISRVDGLILLACFVAYGYVSFRAAKRDKTLAAQAPGREKPVFRWTNIVFLVGGTIILALGAEGMVRGAVGIAEALGVSKNVIGLTIVAFGTSIPELAASAVAAKHKESDLALGNIIGSNIYNILLILGTCGVITPVPTHIGGTSVDFMFFLGLALIIVPMSLIGRCIGRAKGALLLVSYGTFFAILTAQQ